MERVCITLSVCRSMTTAAGAIDCFFIVCMVLRSFCYRTTCLRPFTMQMPAGSPLVLSEFLRTRRPLRSQMLPAARGRSVSPSAAKVNLFFGRPYK